MLVLALSKLMPVSGCVGISIALRFGGFDCLHGTIKAGGNSIGDNVAGLGDRS